ncbi:unnamed protein product, partial [Pocillopora meandrina]
CLCTCTNRCLEMTHSRPVQIFDTRVIFGYDDSPMVNIRACAITIHTSISSHRWLDGNMSGRGTIDKLRYIAFPMIKPLALTSAPQLIRVLSFALKASSDLFEERLNSVMQGVKGITGCVDDVLARSVDSKDHYMNMFRLLETAIK